MRSIILLELLGSATQKSCRGLMSDAKETEQVIDKNPSKRNCAAIGTFDLLRSTSESEGWDVKLSTSLLWFYREEDQSNNMP